MSKVDVIVPCYRYAHFLRNCVESVLNQAVSDVRVLIIDDASPDHTAEVAAELAGRDSRVEFRRHLVNQGHIATYNEGLEWATGEYVLLLSADDMLTPGALLRAIRMLDAHPEVGLAYGRVIQFQRDQPPCQKISPSGDCSWKLMSYREFLEMCCTIGHTSIQSPEVIVRNRVHRMVGGYRKELPHSGDTELWLRLAAQASVGVLDADQAFQRCHDESMSRQYAVLGNLREQRAAFEIHFREYARQIGDVEPYRRRLLQALGESAFWSAYKAFEHGDVAASAEQLSFSVEMAPSIRSWPQWSRWRWKRLMGPMLWSCLRPLVKS
jgi:glycosyltransferase involved in cell wall biosynthesis